MEFAKKSRTYLSIQFWSYLTRNRCLKRFLNGIEAAVHLTCRIFNIYFQLSFVRFHTDSSNHTSLMSSIWQAKKFHPLETMTKKFYCNNNFHDYREMEQLCEYFIYTYWVSANRSVSKRSSWTIYLILSNFHII